MGWGPLRNSERFVDLGFQLSCSECSVSPASSLHPSKKQDSKRSRDAISFKLYYKRECTIGQFQGFWEVYFAPLLWTF